jgi:hypothetical protein
MALRGKIEEILLCHRKFTSNYIQVAVIFFFSYWFFFFKAQKRVSNPIRQTSYKCKCSWLLHKISFCWGSIWSHQDSLSLLRVRPWAGEHWKDLGRSQDFPNTHQKWTVLRLCVYLHSNLLHDNQGLCNHRLSDYNQVVHLGHLQENHDLTLAVSSSLSPPFFCPSYL